MPPWMHPILLRRVRKPEHSVCVCVHVWVGEKQLWWQVIPKGRSRSGEPGVMKLGFILSAATSLNSIRWWQTTHLSEHVFPLLPFLGVSGLGGDIYECTLQTVDCHLSARYHLKSQRCISVLFIRILGKWGIWYYRASRAWLKGVLEEKKTKTFFSVITKGIHVMGRNLDNGKDIKPEIPLLQHTAICLTRQLCVHI